MKSHQQQLLTRSTAIELSSQGNQTMEAYWVDSNVASNNRILQFVTNNSMSICVSIKNLGKENTAVVLAH